MFAHGFPVPETPLARSAISVSVGHAGPFNERGTISPEGIDVFVAMLYGSAKGSNLLSKNH